MLHKLRCRLCGSPHKATSKNFPLTLKDKEGKIIGYACRKCQDRYHRDRFIKEYEVKQRPGQTLKKAIQERSEELRRLRVKTATVATPKPKKESWIKKIFNRRKEIS
jgi:PHP family Zn ribbon phosphoesterase